MNRLVISPRAVADLEEIGDYIADENPAAAMRLIDRFKEISVMLRDNPRLGPARDDIAAGQRHFPVGRYLVLYREIDNGVEIVRFVHGMRRLRGLV